MLAGGFGQGRAPEDEDHAILLSVKEELEQRLSRTISELRALQVKTQVVAGVNYLMKVKADGNYMHVKIAKPLPHTGQNPFLLAVHHENITEESPLNPIE